ncbi:MAG: ATP-grasp domain-containing protein [Candidatus Hodarchaeota archaeon]
MNQKLIFIFEFVSGGGFNQVEIPSSLFCEGFGMLRSIITDFKALGFEIHTLLDSRIFFLSKFLKADNIRKINKHDDYLQFFKNLVKKCNYIFIIAPETSNILYKLTKICKNSKKILLSTNLYGIKKGTSKIITNKFFENYGVLTPRTYRIPYKKNHLDESYIREKFRTLKRRVIIKPEDGVGAESIHYIEDEIEISNFLENFNVNLEKNRKYIIQEFIEGKDLSISLIGCPHFNESPKILSINSQKVSIKNLKSEYLGGCTPLENHRDINKKLSKIMKRINFLKIEGYFGIDLIEKHDHSFYFIELNPRLTTSYIGIRNVINLNFAELLLNSKFKIQTEPEINMHAYSCFTRIDFCSNKFENLETFYENFMPKLIRLIPEIVTPPISLDDSKNFSCFIATQTKDLYSSKIRVNEIIQTLQNLNFKVVKPIKIKLL